MQPRILGAEFRERADCAREHPPVDVGHETEAHGGRQERQRAHEPVAGVETQQRFVVRDLAVLDVQQRLVIEHEAVRVERGADPLHPVNIPRHRLAALLGDAVHLRAVAAVRLGSLTSDVGLGDQLVRAEPLAADRRDADAALHVKHAVPLDVLQAAHELENLRCDDFRVLTADVLEEHDELVAAEARDEVLGAHAVADLERGELQQLVAGHVAASVVHVLELIEIDEEQRAALLRPGAAQDLRLELRDQSVAVVETRERVVVREMQEVLLALAQRADRVVERGHDRAQLLVARARELHVKVARREPRKRPL